METRNSWLGTVYDYIMKNPTLFEGGDIFIPMDLIMWLGMANRLYSRKGFTKRLRHFAICDECQVKSKNMRRHYEKYHPEAIAECEDFRKNPEKYIDNPHYKQFFKDLKS